MMAPLEHLRMIKGRAAGMAPNGDLKRIRALRFTEPGFDRGTWREMCGNGWLGMRAREFCDLLGIDYNEIVHLREENQGVNFRDFIGFLLAIKSTHDEIERQLAEKKLNI